MKSSPVFIHSLFRTGSTYIWNKFRRLPEYLCYYEPFHQLLGGVTPKNVRDTLTQNFKAAGHPELDRHYLYEYETLLREGIPGVPFFRKGLSFDWFCQAGGDAGSGQRKYIDFLIAAAGTRIPLFQFNRTALRSGWFKTEYPDSANIYLYRNPRDQWQSYASIQARTGYDRFFIMDLVALSKNRENSLVRPLGHALPLLTFHSADYGEEEIFYRTLARAYGEREKYFIFYYLWLVSLLENSLHADALWDIDALSRDGAHRSEARKWLAERTGAAIDFNDCEITRYSDFPLPAGALAEIEAQVRELVFLALPAYSDHAEALPAAVRGMLPAPGRGESIRGEDEPEGSLLGDWLQREKAIRRMREDLEARENELGQCVAALAREARSAEKRTEESEALRAQLKESRESGTLLTEKNEALTAQLEESRESVALLENKVNLLLHSHSFRIGRTILLPLRTGKKIFFRLMGPSLNHSMARSARTVAGPEGSYEKKISVVEQVHLNFGRHRSGLKYGLQYLLRLHHPQGVILDAFIERTFCWQPQRDFFYQRPWIGFIHVPPRLPEWFHPQMGNTAIFKSQPWQQSLPCCRGLYAFSRYHQRHLTDLLPVPVDVLRLPSEVPRLTWSWEAFQRNRQKKIVQLGWWLRKLHAIFQFPRVAYQKVFLDVGHPDLSWLMVKEKEILMRNGDFHDVDTDSVAKLPFLSNHEYDRLLSQNIVFMELYDSSACNAIVECMVRHTPLLVNPLEAVVEYLGEGYPLYFRSLAEAAEKVMNPDLIFQTHEYLCRHPRQLELNGEHFFKRFVESAIYRSLAASPGK